MSTSILVIEDDEQTRENVAEWLRLNGFIVETAADGKQGITQAILERPDLILCDVTMPVMNGHQVLETIRSNRSLTTIPFMFLTGKSDLRDIRQGMALGADDYLTKPFTGESLLQAIETRLQREALRKASLQAQITGQNIRIAQATGHEYNTTLNGVIGLSTFLISHLDEFDSVDAISMLESIRVCGWRLKRSLDNVHLMDTLQFLDPSQAVYAQFTSGTTGISSDLIRNKIALVESRQEVKLSWRLDVADAQIQIAKENLRIILDELIDNAAKFSDETGIVITGSLDSAGYRLVISNKGQVFKPENIAQIAPYQQFDRKKYEQQGLGLGLAIVKKLLELNKGTLSIECYPDSWTKVVVWLPLATTASNPEEN